MPFHCQTYYALSLNYRKNRFNKCVHNLDKIISDVFIGFIIHVNFTLTITIISIGINSNVFIRFHSQTQGTTKKLHTLEYRNIRTGPIDR
jgi:hypothetical protein